MLFESLIPFYNDLTKMNYTYWTELAYEFNIGKKGRILPCMGLLEISSSNYHAICIYQINVELEDRTPKTTIDTYYIDPWYGGRDFMTSINYGYGSTGIYIMAN